MAKAMVDTAHHLYLWGHDTSVSSAYIDTGVAGCGTGPAGIDHTDTSYRRYIHTYTWPRYSTDTDSTHW